MIGFPKKPEKQPDEEKEIEDKIETKEANKPEWKKKKESTSKSLVRAISFPSELWQQLQEESKNRFISVSGLVRQCIVEYFDRKR